jgi:hypothetical protein
MSSRWRTKASACLLARTGAKTVEEAIVRIIDRVKRAAFDQGYTKGTLEPPYDPAPLALVFGASEVRAARLDFDGHVLVEDEKVIVEYDEASTSQKRNRFTIAHEVGHLALWHVSPNRRRLPARRSPTGSEIEELCNKLAAEILAPRQEVRKLWSTYLKTGALSKSSFVLNLADQFDISLNFAGVRFKEVCGPRAGVGLLNIPEKRFEWCHGISSRFRLLTGLIASLPSLKPVGTNSYSVDTTTGIRMIPFEWKHLSEGRYLIITVS